MTSEGNSPGVQPPIRWIGDLRGTHVGNVFAEFRQLDDKNTVGVLRTNVAGAITVFDAEIINGTSKILLKQRVTDGVPSVRGHIDVDAVRDGTMQGRWELSDGSAGTVELVRKEIPPSGESNTPQPKPLQLISKSVDLGPLTIGRNDLEGLFALLRAIFSEREPIITAPVDGLDVRLAAKDFLQLHLPHAVGKMEIFITDGASAIQRIVHITLNREAENKLLVQSDDYTWTHGTCLRMEAHLSRYSSRFVRRFRRWGLEVNGLVFLLALAFIGDLKFVQRVVFLVGVLAVLICYRWLFTKTVATTVTLDDTKKSWIQREMPTIASSLLVAAVVAAISQISALLGGENMLTELWNYFRS